MTARFQTLQEWLQWQETLHPSVIELGLERVRAVAVALWGVGFASQQPLTITVGGTNGKGSCVTALSVLLQAMGRRVGTFTSPHLFRYNERIRIDNAEIGDDELCEAFAAIDAARGETSLTYFEFNTLAALWLFRKHRVDIQVLEVGLGGRLDAVNLLDADIAVITNVALDHVDWLGNTREAIGWEKAGILRPGGKLVYGEVDMPASVQRMVGELGVACRQWHRDFSLHADVHQMEWRGLSAGGVPLVVRSPLPSLPLPSVACALQVLAWLGLCEAEVIARMMAGIQLRGRLEQHEYHGQRWLFDVAHNEAGAVFLAQHLPAYYPDGGVAIFSAMADKDLVGVLRALSPQIRQWILFPLQDSPRAATLQQLQSAAMEAGIASSAIQSCSSVSQAVSCARSLRWPVLVFGSFFTVAAVMQEQLNEH